MIPPPTRASAARVLVCALLGLAVSACAEPREERPPAASAACELQIIVAASAALDRALVADLERVARARLEAGASIAADSRAFVLRADGADAACVAALDRLRGDARVRSVEIDARRRPNRP